MDKNNTLRLFPEIRKATFIRRPNRFVVECSLDGVVTSAYMPNPGRLRELLLPESTIYLTYAGADRARKYRYTAVAAVRDDTPILLHTHLSNSVVRWLIEKGELPGFENTVITKAEVTAGKSRFDFLLEKAGRPFLLEVKSCTQFGQKIAMFPDAVTERGQRHLMELSHHAGNGTPGGVIFLVHWSRADYFLPDYHTDLEFAKTLLKVRKHILVKTISIGWDHEMCLNGKARELSIPWHIVGQEAQDGGSYMLILRMKRDRTIDVGKMKSVFFQKGYYIYVGSAKTNLNKRMKRHLRKRKNFFWHIDYLRDNADHCTAIPIRTIDDLDCQLAQAMDRIAPISIPKFGSSDCSCQSHLFFMKENPLQDASFIDTLLYFRMNRLHGQLT